MFQDLFQLAIIERDLLIYKLLPLDTIKAHVLWTFIFKNGTTVL
jgi:hypothetical protein